MKPLDFVILALATWRLASLFANESGPFHIFKTFREWICNNHPGIGEGLTCEWCNSVWFGTLITLAYLWGGNRSLDLHSAGAFNHHHHAQILPGKNGERRLMQKHADAIVIIALIVACLIIALAHA